MTDKERMLAGLSYIALDPQLREEMKECKLKLYKFNNLTMDSLKERIEVLRSILGKSGENLYIEPPFYCDYGKNIEIGSGFYANYNLHVLDCAKVIIGDNVFIGPMCGIYTAAHPIDASVRAEALEYAKEIRIGDDVWIGGGVTINPGVSIGSNVVIGAGSVVTKDIPDNVIAFGNPCKVYREITGEDRDYWQKQLDDYKNQK